MQFIILLITKRENAQGVAMTHDWGGGGSTSPECPTCESPELERRTSTEHDACGCIRPREAFTTDDDSDDLVCPECGDRERPAEFSTVSEFYVCPDCLQRFEPRVLTSSAITARHARRASGEPTTASPDSNDETARGDGTDSLADFPTWSLWTVAVLAVSAIAFSSMALPAVYPLGGHSSTGGGENPTGPETSSQRDSAAPNDLTSNYTPPGPGTYGTIVVYRNDDVQSNFKPAALRDVTELFVEEGVPITHGVFGDTPPTASVCQYLHRLNENHPRQFEFSLHGYNHRNTLSKEDNDTRYQLSEFAGLPYRTQRQRIRKGTENVTRCTGERPTTFVPPYDTYDNATIRALDANGYRTISGATWFYDRNDSLFTYEDIVHVGYLSGSDSVQLYYNYTASSGAHSLAAMKRSFDRAYRNHSLFLFTIHHQHFTAEKDLERLRTFVEYQKSKDVAFMTVGQVSRAFRQGRLHRTEDGWVLDGGNGSTPETATASRRDDEIETGESP